MADAHDQKPSQSDPNAASHSDHSHDSHEPELVISINSAKDSGDGHGHHHQPHPRKVKLLGRVGEEEACSLLTDRTQIVVGSGQDCDLVLSDPLVPARAFVLRHVKEHGDLHESCGSCWQLEAYPGARVFINRHIVRRELIHFGDTISIGCHLLFFVEGDVSALNRRVQVEVQGLCRDLISAVPVPAGYLHSLGSWRDRLRTQTAARWGSGLAAALLLAMLLTPRMKAPEFATDHLSVVIVPDQSSLPEDESKAILSRVGKRPINAVARRSVAMTEQMPEAPDQLAVPTPPIPDPSAAPILQESATTPKAAAPELKGQLVADAGALSTAAPLGLTDGTQLTVMQNQSRLATGASGPRQTQEEVVPEASPRELSALPPQMITRDPPALAMTSTSTLNAGPSPLDRIVPDAGSLGAPAAAEAQPAPAAVATQGLPTLARGNAGPRQTREETVAVNGAEGTLQSFQPQLTGAGGADPQAVAMTATAPGAPGAAPGGRLMQDAGTLNAADAFVVHVGPNAAVGRSAPVLARGNAAQRQAREESFTLAAPGTGSGGAGGDSLQTFIPQAGAGNAQALAMAVGPGLQPVTAPAGRVAQDAGAVVGGQGMVAAAGPQASVARGSQQLVRGASGPRQAYAESVAALGVPGGSMQAYQPRLDARGKVVITAATGRIGHVASTGKLETNRTEVVGAMQLAASPLDFTEYRGHRIPVARMSEALSTLTIADGSEGHILDGSISTSEVATSWKSGRFRVHGPGQPPAAEPATQCYVGKSKVNGKDYLYIGFVCSDPNPGQIVYTHTNGGTYTERDDSIEIFLDTRATRYSYNHMIVNTGGKFVAYYCPDPDKGINGLGTPWDPGAEIKTHIDHQKKQWTCEVLIPFDRLGGVPAKGSQWPVNFSRNFRGQAHPQQVLSSWFLVYEGASQNYHHPKLFGLFQW